MDKVYDLIFHKAFKILHKNLIGLFERLFGKQGATLFTPGDLFTFPWREVDEGILKEFSLSPLKSYLDNLSSILHGAESFNCVYWGTVKYIGKWMHFYHRNYTN